MQPTDRATIAAYITQWADSEINPHFAVLLDGEWGSGKTHFILKSSALGKIDRQKVYVSLFGISSVETLQSALFFASASKTAKGIRHIAGMIGGALKTVRLDINSDGNQDIEIDGQLTGLNKFIEQKAKTLDEALLIFDDLERCKIPMADLLGTLNQYIEHSNARVLILANSKEIKGDDFKSFQEKIIGQSFRLAADADTALQTFIDDQSIQNHIRRQTDYILELHKKSGYHNLRALRQFVYQLAQIFAALNEKHKNNEELHQALTLELFFGFMEFKLNLCPESQTLTIADMGKTTTLSQTDDRAIYPEHVKKDEQKPYRNRVLEKYFNYYGINQMAVSVPIWAEILETGLINPEQFNDDIFLPQLQERNSWQRLWWLLDTELDEDGQQQFELDLADVQSKLQDGAYTLYDEFMHVAAIALNFSRHGLWGKNTAVTLAEMREYITRHIKPCFNFKDHKTIDLNFSSRTYGLGYTDHDTEEFKKLVACLAKAHEDWKNHYLEKQAGSKLSALMHSDFDGFIHSIAGRNKAPLVFYDTAILHTLDPKDFADKWLALNREQERRIPYIFRERLRYNDIRKLEAPWWAEVKKELQQEHDAVAAQPNGKARAYQIGSLIRIIESEGWDQLPK